MKESDIKVGHTYCNRGKGRTQRKVLGIGTDIPAPWYSSMNSPVVRYEQKGTVSTLYLFSFAAWAGRDVTEE